jgi:amino acid transporter
VHQESGLRRVLTLWDLVFYGIVLIQPIAAVPLFGLADTISRGHVVTTILIAMVAMMLTAISYGRMATKYPKAGSAYTYVSRGLNANLGFLAGWAMILDYLLIPVLNVIYGALTLARVFSFFPYWTWAAILSVLITFLNVRGIKSTARTNIVLLVLMCGVIGAFMLLAIVYLYRLGGTGALISTQPFYTPGTTDLSSIATATSLAALTYIGFDGVTTLSEEVKNPGKNVLRATVLVCFVTGVFSGAQVYLAQRVWPDYTSFPNVETAFMDISRRVGGASLFSAMAFTLILASLGSGLGGQAGAARVLFGMGREGALPRKVFAHLDSANGVPNWNLWMIGIVAFAGSLILNFERAAELLNFGAFLAFMGVNLAAMKQFYFNDRGGRSKHWFKDLFLPALGFLFCFWICWNLPRPAKLAGGLWFAGGVIYLTFMTSGFRRRPVQMDFMDS